tara:strand:+ start:15062 stop:15712 length:651 start_codon:yes stop_codon:yes gene_type:complete
LLKLNPTLNKLKQEDRLYQMPVPVIGLTGGIASGKSSVSQILRTHGLSIIDADLLVKSIYRQEDIIEHISALAPETITAGAIDFKKLREVFFSSTAIQSKIEKLIYAQMPSAFNQTYKTQLQSKQDFIIYDVPLLFEKKLAPLVDHKVCVWCPKEVQIARLIQRDGITHELALKMLDRQWDIDKKKSESDEIIDNSKTKTELNHSVSIFIKNLLSN